MRFKFVGGSDAPDWFLQETVFLSQISAVRFKLIVIVVYRYLLGGQLEVRPVFAWLLFFSFFFSFSFFPVCLIVP